MYFMLRTDNRCGLYLTFMIWGGACHRIRNGRQLPSKNYGGAPNSEVQLDLMWLSKRHCSSGAVYCTMRVKIASL